MMNKKLLEFIKNNNGSTNIGDEIYDKNLNLTRESVILEGIGYKSITVLSDKKEKYIFDKYIFVGDIDGIFMSMFNFDNYNNIVHNYIMKQIQYKLDKYRCKGFIDKIIFEKKFKKVNDYLFIGFITPYIYNISLNLIGKNSKQIFKNIIGEYCNVVIPKGGNEND